MNVQTVTITKEIAGRLLATNQGNRRANHNHVEFLAKEMSSGRWKNNYSPIRVGQDGRLLDGQHRCLAVVKSGVPIESLVVYGLPDETFVTIDAGQKPRTACNALHVIGKKNTMALAGAARFIYGYKNKLDDPTRFPMKMSNGVILDIVEVCGEELDRAVSFCGNSRVARLSNPSLSSGLLYLFAKVDRDAAYDFWGMLSTGSGVESFETMYILRERLISNTYNKMKMSTKCMAALIVKTWNAWRTGKPLRVLKFNESGECAEMFPRIHGEDN